MIFGQKISDYAFGKESVLIARISIGRFDHPNESAMSSGEDKHNGDDLRTENMGFLSSLVPMKESSQ